MQALSEVQDSSNQMQDEDDQEEQATVKSAA
jgi:hypothetical protein